MGQIQLIFVVVGLTLSYSFIIGVKGTPSPTLTDPSTSLSSKPVENFSTTVLSQNISGNPDQNALVLAVLDHLKALNPNLTDRIKNWGTIGLISHGKTDGEDEVPSRRRRSESPTEVIAQVGSPPVPATAPVTAPVLSPPANVSQVQGQGVHQPASSPETTLPDTPEPGILKESEVFIKGLVNKVTSFFMGSNATETISKRAAELEKANLTSNLNGSSIDETLSGLAVLLDRDPVVTVTRSISTKVSRHIRNKLSETPEFTVVPGIVKRSVPNSSPSGSSNMNLRSESQMLKMRLNRKARSIGVDLGPSKASTMTQKPKTSKLNPEKIGLTKEGFKAWTAQAKAENKGKKAPIIKRSTDYPKKYSRLNKVPVGVRTTSMTSAPPSTGNENDPTSRIGLILPVPFPVQQQIAVQPVPSFSNFAVQQFPVQVSRPPPQQVFFPPPPVRPPPLPPNFQFQQEPVRVEIVVRDAGGASRGSSGYEGQGVRSNGGYDSPRSLGGGYDTPTVIREFIPVRSSYEAPPPPPPPPTVIREFVPVPVRVREFVPETREYSYAVRTSQPSSNYGGGSPVRALGYDSSPTTIVQPSSSSSYGSSSRFNINDLSDLPVSRDLPVPVRSSYSSSVSDEPIRVVSFMNEVEDSPRYKRSTGSVRVPVKRKGDESRAPIMIRSIPDESNNDKN